MKLSLNKEWKLLYRDLSAGPDQVPSILAAADFIDAGVLPCDAHVPLINAGIIKDPVTADYCHDCGWMEQKSFWYCKEFSVTAKQLKSRAARLTIESLDLYAHIFINGKLAGTHQSCHYPFTSDIIKYLKEGANNILIRLTMGPEEFSRNDMDYLYDYISAEYERRRKDRGEKARAFLRKPQYVYGWDWGPRIGTVGIMKNAWIEFLDDIAVIGLHPVTLEIANQCPALTNMPSVPDNQPPASGSKQPAYGAKLRFETAFENLLVISTQEVYLTLDFKFEDRIVYTETRNVLALSGINYVDFDVTLPEARLWWPNGAGEQPLYTAVLSVKGERQTVKTDPVRFGIRTIKLDTSKCNGGGEGSADGQSSVSGKSSAGSESGNKRNFAFIVNGIRIYCKGGNWIPADSIYARVSPQKYRTLISEARECNFNMLRIWGGGIYERDEFYDYCDESGILVWHDFMFACSHYPDDQRWFTELVRSEIDYQTKRLRGHPCLALWCGNNENPMMLYNRYFKKFLESGITGGYYLYNELIPSIIRSNCPEIPYWPSSPYGGEDPNGNDAGDRHHWDDCTMNPDMEKRITPEEYDKITSGFISEYGYIGPCSDASIKKYFGDNPIDRNGSIWDLHNNTFEKATVPEGIRKHYADPEKLPLKDYLRYARLVQGLMYSYSLESIRFCPNNNGSLFWMYNDTWGEVGWTIIDYYLDRKPSYYYIKRAFAPVKFILRRSADKKKILVMGCNDTNADKKIELEYGYVSFTGKYDTVKKIVDLPAFSKGIVLVFDMPKGDLKNGLVFARGGQAPLAVLRTNAYRDYAAAASIVTVKKVETAGRDAAVTLASSGYSHAVSLGLKPGVHPEDDYFDMLPSEVRVIKILDAAGLIKSGKIETDKIKPIYLNTSNKY